MKQKYIFFLKFSCFFYDSVDGGSLISGSSAFSKANLHIWNLSVPILLKPSLNDFERYLTSMWSEHNCMVVWAFFCIVLFWDWNENWPWENHNSERHMYPSVHCSTLCNNLDMEATYISIDWWINKEDVVHTMKYDSYFSLFILIVIKGNKFESVVVKWMNLELLIQSEVRRRKTSIIY